MNCRGTHLIADLYDCRVLDDVAVVEAALREAVDVLGATLIALKLHKFGGGGGVTGVALLAESHLSIHSWPEDGYAAVDIFVCGADAALDAAVDGIGQALGSGRREVRRVLRGRG